MAFFTLAKTVIQSLFKRPITVAYPFAPYQSVEKTRGSIQITISDCIFCGLCQRKCPTAAINVAREQKTWEIDRLRCVVCNACVEVCPKKCLRMDTQYTPVSTARSKDLVRI